MPYIDPENEHELLAHLRHEVLRSRFASMDEAIILGMSDEDSGLRLIHYLDRFIGAVQEQSSRHVHQIEASLRHHLSEAGFPLEAIEVELSPLDQELRHIETIPLDSLIDHTEFIDRMKSIREMIISALDDNPRGGFRR